MDLRKDVIWDLVLDDTSPWTYASKAVTGVTLAQADFLQKLVPLLRSATAGVHMASHTFCTGALRGTQLRTLQTNDRQKRLKNTITVAGSSKKLNTYDDKWSKGFFGSGYFMEDKEADAPNYLRSLERKKVLSNIEQLGLLSAAEKAGLSLSKLEELKLFSTAERLGLLSTLERLLNSDPAAVSSLSLVPLVGTIATLSLLPSEPAPLAIAKFAAAAVLGGSTVVLFGLGILVAAIQEE